MFDKKKKEELEREEFLMKRVMLQASADARKLSYGNQEELLNLSTNDKIDAIFELLLLNSEYYTVNLLHNKYCKKKNSI